MSLWKCFYCSPIGHAFESEDPQCPKCSAKGEHIIAPMVLIHYLYRDKDGPVSGMHGFAFRSACNPGNAYALMGGTPHTDQPGAVTCPKCLATDRYKRDASFDKKIGPRVGITADAKDCCG